MRWFVSVEGLRYHHDCSIHEIGSLLSLVVNST